MQLLILQLQNPRCESEGPCRIARFPGLGVSLRSSAPVPTLWLCHAPPCRGINTGTRRVSGAKLESGLRPFANWLPAWHKEQGALTGS